MKVEEPYIAGFRDAVHKVTRALEGIAYLYEQNGADIDPPSLRHIAISFRENAEKPPARLI